MIIRLLPACDGEVLCTHAQGVIHEHPMMAGLPSVQPFFYPPSDAVGCGDVSDSLHDHHLEDNEPLQVPLSVPHPVQLSPQRLNESSPNFPAWHVIAPRWHDRKVTPPLLPRRVIPDAASEVCARVDVDPVSVDHPDTEVLRGQGVPWLVPLLSFPVRRCRRMASPFLSLCAAGCRSFWGCWCVSARSVLFPHSLRMHPGLHFL